MVNLRGIDLNLLVTLDALLDEAHVGNAAERLGMSQPAASNALARARKLFNDRLLVRVPPYGLRCTPRAEALRDSLRVALADLEAVIAPVASAEAGLRGAVRLVASDVPGAALGAALASELAIRAPGIDLVFHPWHAGDEVDRLERGEVDLVVAVSAFFGASLRAELLGTYPYTVLMRKAHPASASETLDLDGWLAFPHIVVSGRGDRRGSVEAALANVGRSRRVAAVAPTFLHALELISRTDMLGAFPTGVLTSVAAAGLTTRPLPVAVEPVSLHVVRHRRTDTDPSVMMIAGLIRKCASAILT